MGDKLGGRWLKPVPGDHECRTPWLWGVKEGRRWQCLAVIGGTMVTGGKFVGEHKCEKVWHVGRHDDGGKGWFPDEVDDESTKDTFLHRFRLATDEEIMYWVVGTLTAQGDHDPKKVEKGGVTFPVRQVVEAIKGNFKIGKTQ